MHIEITVSIPVSDFDNMEYSSTILGVVNESLACNFEIGIEIL